MHRGDYNSVTSDIFRSFWLNVRPLLHYLSNAMYGCPAKLSKFMAIDDFGQSFLQPYNLLWSCIQYVTQTNTIHRAGQGSH